MSSPLRAGAKLQSISNESDTALGPPRFQPGSQIKDHHLLNLMLETQNMGENNHMALMGVIKGLEARMESIERQISLLVSAVAISPSLRANTSIDSNKGSNTSKVMYCVPVILLLSLWRVERENKPFPCSTKYMYKICSWMSKSYPVNVRSALGAIFDTAMREPESMTLGAMSTLLSASRNKDCLSLRENINFIYKCLATTHAFLIPSVLHEFISHIGNVEDTGQVIFRDSVQNRTPAGNIRNAINPGKVYNRMGEDWIISNASNAIKYGVDRSSSTNYFRSLSKWLYDGRTPSLEEIMTINSLPPDTPYEEDSLWSTSHDINSDVNSTTSGYSRKSNYKKKNGGSKAASLFE